MNSQKKLCSRTLKGKNFRAPLRGIDKQAGIEFNFPLNKLSKNKETLSKSLSSTFSQNSSNFRLRENPSFYFQGREGKNIVNLDEENIAESLPQQNSTRNDYLNKKETQIFQKSIAQQKISIQEVPKQKQQEWFIDIELLCSEQNFFWTLDNNEKQKDQECLICAQKLTDSSYKIEKCSHIFHMKCIKELISFNISQKKWPIYCPMENCGDEISRTDILTLFSLKEYSNFKKYEQKKCISSHPHLLTPNCEGFMKKSDLISKFFKCKICFWEYCTQCDKKWHSGPCIKESQDLEFIRFARKNHYKQCPQCRRLVEKTVGCNHITCRCSYEFCYVCQKQYHQQCMCRRLPFQLVEQMIEQQRIQEQEQIEKIYVQQRKEKSESENKSGSMRIPPNHDTIIRTKRKRVKRDIQ